MKHQVPLDNILTTNELGGKTKASRTLMERVRQTGQTFYLMFGDGRLKIFRPGKTKTGVSTETIKSSAGYDILRD